MVLLPSMDIYHNVPVSGSLPPISTPQDFSYSMDGDEQDVSLEWLSIFVEDCLSSTTTSFMTLPITPSNTSTIPSQTPKDLNSPSKPRTKRRKTTPNPNPNPKPKPKPKAKASCDISHNSILYDPPLLHQTQWLADSELIFPKKDPLIVDRVEKQGDKDEEDEDEDEEGEEQEQHQQEQEQEQEKQQQLQQQQQQARRCSHCLSQRTPQWRAGPLGPKTLCNACGVRFKSGRLLPEYRPAKSPTFVSYKHSNSHKKVMEMRMSIMSTNSISN